MISKKRGAIVLVSSTAGQRGESEHSHYAASKGAQISFVKSLAVELAPHNIRVNAVAPGWVETDMTAKALDRIGDKIRAQMPLGRAARPEEIAKPILFLASDAASFITGEVLNVNGGSVLCG
jgi:3-oxoacyl-[acyl-carrier protein] reductase